MARLPPSDLAAVDLSAGLMQPMDLPWTQSLPAAAKGEGTIVVHVNAPFMSFALWTMGRNIVNRKYVIGYWAWELPVVPPDWQGGADYCHEIWVPSRFVADAVTPIAAGRPIKVVPHPVLGTGIPPLRQDWSANRGFNVLCMFNAASSVARKNPVAAIKAFRTAFGADASVCLTVKIANPKVYPEGLAVIEKACEGALNIRLLCETLPPDAIDVLYAETDTVISLHRSEGFGLVVAEAMMRGIPVVATNWSGSAEFLTEDAGIPISYTLVPARDPQETYNLAGAVWAEPSVEHAAGALRRLREDADLRRKMGTQGRELAMRLWGASSFSSTVRDYIHDRTD